MTIESKTQLEVVIFKLEKKLAIKATQKAKSFFFNSIIDGMRYETMARHGKKPREKALEQTNDKKRKY